MKITSRMSGGVRGYSVKKATLFRLVIIFAIVWGSFSVFGIGKAGAATDNRNSYSEIS
jgi:hypothetical protein